MITFIAVAHLEPMQACPLVESLLNQTCENWKLLVYHNGPNKSMQQWIESYGDKRIMYRESPVDTGKWGTANRDHAIRELVDTEFLINTSIQDYYLPCAVQEITQELSTADLVHWQGINHLFNYNIVNGEIAFAQIDWGQWCIRTSMIRHIGVVMGEQFSSDWLTLQEVIKRNRGIKTKKVNQVLTIHN
jgi:hypothetical protein